MKTGIQKAKERYEKWWLGKYCRVAAWGDNATFNLVTGINLIGPPSFVYGDVELIFDNGEKFTIPQYNQNSYVPRKKDIETITQDEYKSRYRVTP